MKNDEADEEKNNLGENGKDGKNGKELLQDSGLTESPENRLGKNGKELFPDDWFNEPQKVAVKGVRFTGGKRFEKSDSFVFVPEYSLLEVQLAPGTSPYILAVPFYITITKGANTLYLKPAKDADYHIPESVKKSFLKAWGRGEDDKFEDLKIILELGSPISKKLIKKLKSFSREQINDIIHDYLCEGMNKDPTFEYVLRAHVIRRTHGQIPPSAIMPSNPHTLIVSRANIGKSTGIDKITRENNFDRLTKANALGFATAEEVNQGSLNNFWGVVGVDEVDKSDDQILAKLPNFMQTGSANIGTGKQKIRTEGGATFILNGNPPKVGENKNECEIMQSFNQILNRLGGDVSVEAMGKRIACVMYGQDYVQISGMAHLKDYNEKVKKIIEYLVDEVILKVEKIILNREVEAWLSQKNDSYERDVENLIAKGRLFPDVNAFLQGHAKNAYGHMRGFAINQAFMDHLGDLFHEEMEYIENLIPNILASAELHLAKLGEINLRSFETMLEPKSKKGEYTVKRFDNLSPAWLKALVYAVYRYYEANKPDLSYEIVLDQVGMFWKALPLAEKLNDTTYQHFSKIEEKLLKFPSHVEGRLESFGIAIIHHSHNIYIINLNKTKFIEFVESMREFSSVSPKDSPSDLDELLKIFGKEELHQDSLIKAGLTEAQLNDALRLGLIFEVRPGVFRRV